MTGDPVSDERRTTIDGVSVPCDHLIDGKRVGGGERYAVLSPVDGSHLGDIPDGDAAVVDAAVAAARRAFPAWAALGPGGRGNILGRFAQAILDRARDLVMVDTADNGSVRSAMMHAGTGRSAQNILGDAHRDMAVDFAVSGADKFASGEWRSSPNGLPRLEGALAHIECVVDTTYPAGDHHIVVGSVQTVAAETDALPLLFYRSKFHLVGNTLERLSPAVGQ
jgi:hypothetical protein